MGLRSFKGLKLSFERTHLVLELINFLFILPLLTCTRFFENFQFVFCSFERGVQLLNALVLVENLRVLTFNFVLEIVHMDLHFVFKL